MTSKGERGRGEGGGAKSGGKRLALSQLLVGPGSSHFTTLSEHLGVLGVFL